MLRWGALLRCRPVYIRYVNMGWIAERYGPTMAIPGMWFERGILQGLWSPAVCFRGMAMNRGTRLDVEAVS